jgi:chemosensory pili system protein ChpA (sensor histidine kinase/response regulator)
MARSSDRAWIEISRNPDSAPDPTPLVRAAQRVREGGAFEYEGELPREPTSPKSEGSAPPAKFDALPAGEANIVSELDAPRFSRSTAAEVVPAAAPGAAAPSVGTADVPPIAVAAAASALDWDLEFPKVMPSPAPAPAEPAAESSEDIKRIGPLDISHGLYSIFLSEADECIRVLANEVAEWRYEPARAITPSLVRRAHSLCGISRTVGLAPVVAIADPIDELMRTLALGGLRPFACPRSSTRWSVIERVRA